MGRWGRMALSPPAAEPGVCAQHRGGAQGLRPQPESSVSAATTGLEAKRPQGTRCSGGCRRGSHSNHREWGTTRC